jgi:manganese-dependent inorganic pyrophosphatase
MLIGDKTSCVTKGKVLIAAANPDLMEDYIEEGDIVILGNRYESQLCAIEMSAACIIVCDGAPVSMTIKKLAEERGCAVICTPHDTYTVARLINQSMPIRYFMRADNLIAFEMDEPVESIKEIMKGVRHRDFPVLDMDGEFVGMVSRRNLLNLKRKQLILVDHNEKAQAIDGIEETEILEIIDHHRLGSLETIAPVFFRNQPLGCTATIIYKMFCEQKVEIPERIAGLLCAAIISDTLMFRSPTCTKEDEQAAIELAKISKITIREFAGKMFKAGSNLEDKTPEEIFYQDFKKTNVGNITFGVGQVNALNADELLALRNRMIPYLDETHASHGVNMLFFMLTNIIEERTELIFFGDGSATLAEKAFQDIASDWTDNTCILQGVVSRKKQLIPKIVLAMQE